MTLPERGNVQRLPIPANLDPDFVCFQLSLPDDPEYIQMFLGKLRELGLWVNYDRDSAKSGKAVAETWRYVESTLKPCIGDCDCEDCDCEDCGDCSNCSDCPDIECEDCDC